MYTVACTHICIVCLLEYKIDYGSLSLHFHKRYYIVFSLLHSEFPPLEAMWQYDLSPLH